eukprot:gene27546-36341_t
MSTKDTETTKEYVAKRIIAAAELLPQNIKEKAQPYIAKAAPIVGQVAEIIEKLIPFAVLAYNKSLEFWAFLQPYNPQLLAPALCGFILCFFGGSYLTLIAAAEAYRMCGYHTTLENVQSLIVDARKVWDASKKDDDKDEDGDGVKDVNQISPKELAIRKSLLFLRTVDPNKITAAVYGIQTSFLAVAATLKLEFAKTITLGNSIADIVSVPADRVIVPYLEKLTPEAYKKWIKPTVHSIIKSTAISLAWTLQRIISAFHSALRGGLMCSRNVLEYLSKMKIIHINPDETYLDEIVGYALAALGLYFQLSMGFQVPFPLNVLLFPFSCMEYFLIWTVSK